MSFCSFDSTFFGQRVNVQTSLEFLRGSRIQLSCQYLCPSSRARLLLLIRGIAIQLFSLAIPSQYRRLEYHPIPIRYNISTLFCSVECYKSINQVMLHNNQNLRSSPVLPNSLFFLSDETCVRQVLQHLFQTLTKKMLTTVDIAHTPRYVLARCVFWADIGSDWYPMLPPDRVTPTSWVWQNPFSSSNTRLICNCCLTKVPKIRRWKEKCYVLLP